MTSLNIQKLTELRSTVEAARKEMRDAAKEVVRDGSQAIFQEYGDIVGMFGWVQYTPYFCDGDPCEFGVNDLCIYSVEETSDLEEYETPEGWPYETGEDFGGWRGQSFASERHAEARQAIDTLYKVFGIDETLARDIFGDHVSVRFTKGGVEVEDHEHE